MLAAVLFPYKSNEVSIFVILQIIAVKFPFVNPDAVNDVNKILPPGVKFAATNPEQQPQTLQQVEEYLRRQGKIAGEPLALETDAKTLVVKSLVLPVYKRQSNCQTNCQEIVELPTVAAMGVVRVGDPGGLRPPATPSELLRKSVDRA